MKNKFTVDIGSKIIEFDEAIKPRINSTANVTEQSKETYSKLNIKGLKKTILKYLVDKGAATRRMISKGTGIDTGTIPAVMNQLIEFGLVVSSSELHPCKSTGNLAMWQTINTNKIEEVRKMLEGS